MIKPRVFSWRDHVLVEVEDPTAELTGWRVNVLDEVFPSVERAIDAIEKSIVALEKTTGQKWHAGDDCDMVCVVHNCLYWKCDCGKDQMPWSDEHLINFFGANLGKMLQDCELKCIDEFGTPGEEMPKPFQVADCQPGGHPDSQLVNILIVTLWNNTTFVVEIKLKPRD